MTLEPTESFCNQLRRLRQAAGLSQEELAERAGLTPAAIGALERGERRHPYPHTLQLLADALGLSPADRTTFFTSVPKRGSSGANSASAGVPAHPSRWSAPPAPLTTFVGRVRDLAIVTGLFQHGNARMVTLTGPGGVGKTRLAMEVVGQLGADFEIGPVWVDLAPIRGPEQVVPTIARAVGLTESAGPDMVETLESYLGHRQSLLVLDNFEHLLVAAPSVQALLQRCPGLAVLVTSREALRVRGEHEVQVPALGLPVPETVASAEAVARSEAALLFLQRVQAVRPGFEFTDADAPRIAGICVRLDGVPLALELAAVQLKYMSPTALLDGLENRLTLLEGGPRDLPARQQSLRATIAWSYELLAASEQDLFRRLAIFAGGFTREAVQAICDSGKAEADQAARTLAALVDKSVVQALPDASGEIRFAMLETIREYARERLIEAGEQHLLASRHASYFCDLAEAAAPHLTSASRGVWLRRLEIEAANLRAALAWATSGGDFGIGLRLAGALGWFWLLRGYISEGSSWVDQLLDRTNESDGAEARAYVLYVAAGLAWKREDYLLARRLGEEAVAKLRVLRDRRLPLALSLAGLIATSQGDLGQARRHHEESLSLFTAQNDRWGVAYGLANLGDALLHQGDLEEAERCYSDSLEEFERVGDPWGRGIVLHALGNVAWAAGDAAAARTRYRASVTHLRGVKNDDVARCLIGLAATTLGEADVEEARRLLAEAFTLWLDFGSRSGAALCLAGLAAVQASREHYSEAARLFGAAEAHGRGRPSPYLVDADVFSRYLQETRGRLGEAAFAQAWAQGQAMGLDEALDYALQENVGN